MLLFVGFLVAAPALADPPPWAGGGKKHGKGDDRGSDHYRDYDREGRHFSDRHRMVIREYYGEQFRGGKCPPGLAKKNNGCMPPGQAKKWRIGQPLPRDVVYYRVPPALVVKLPAPSAGQRYVRVAADILLIAVGTGIVIDAVRDLGAM
jgi:Ni/Co efflux regulator RcnB